MRTYLAVIGAALIVSACAEPVTAPPHSAAPTSQPQLLAFPPHVLTWQTQSPSLVFDTGEGDSTDVAHAPAGTSSGAIPLQAYQATIRVWNPRGARLGIDYGGGYRSRPQPFLRLTIPPGSLYRRPDGRPFGPWDWVDVTAYVDSTLLAVHFAPSGLRFNPGCQVLLQLWYGGAGGDYNGDGVVDATDAQIEQNLQLWHQVEPGGPWEPLPAYHSVWGHYFLAHICGFSSYAISF